MEMKKREGIGVGKEFPHSYSTSSLPSSSGSPGATS